MNVQLIVKEVVKRALLCIENSEAGSITYVVSNVDAKNFLYLLFNPAKRLSL